ncbi:MAG: hypothetical protein JNM07_05510 [Phycisphaerae bacterium]|nr:hypothetical protein [Phycisphaerae bacterium]
MVQRRESEAGDGARRFAGFTGAGQGIDSGPDPRKNPIGSPRSPSMADPLPVVGSTAPSHASTPTAPAPAKPEPKPAVAFEEFAKLDLRVARVIKAELHPKADRLFKLQVDDGTGLPRQICAGIRGHYTTEQLEGRLIVIVANLAPRVIRGEESRGMLLAASDVPKDAAESAQRSVIVLQPAGEIAPGAIVS